MHEISLVRSIFNTLEAEFSKAELDRMTAIDLQLGLLSNVEPTLMHNAFAAVTTAEEKFQDVQLNIETVPIEIQCEVCEQTTLVQEYKFACGHCGRPTNNIIRGMELLIHKVHFQELENSF